MPDLAWPILAAALLGGYLLGSIPFGLVLTKIFGLGDIRQIGSGNIGATNVLRTGKKGLALATLILDGGKGAVAALLAREIDPGLAYFAAGAAFLGHLYPVWLRFKGGKGVATFLGIELAIFWPVGMACCAAWAITALVSRYSSLSALVATTVAPVIALLFDQPALAALSLLMAFLVFLRHMPNIRRLRDGTEPRIGKAARG